MYSTLLTLHSWVRWLVLVSLLLALFYAYRGWFTNKPFTKSDNTIRNLATSFAHIQILLGLCLYYISPITTYFLHNFKEAVHQREIRFFGMEHSSVMFIALVVITIGSSKAKRHSQDKQKFKIMALWFTIGLLLILSSIPWAFSPLVSRPYFRAF
ncbi:hypothetical protein [Adhaeribacter pallidiroseus]|uniref:Cytochrome B n=1 Tax=Adhaeribacter pallidiroseus TaxID=2072847 RepID=A0A369QN30_9BACT|nr:hypothetical protein [Adhaeribacter pallidiroseus]RDC65085.1 hypothetical protein AHMF7616_03709 [Adhaeribacter pallidiroseus]